MFEILREIYRQLFSRRPECQRRDGADPIPCDRSMKPIVHFKSVTVLDKTPKNNAVGDKDFITVVYQGKLLWALFRCPCGCDNVISLSLQKIHSPNWRVRKSRAGKPTLYPSVWQNKGCCSHFWIEDGRVLWCSNTETLIQDKSL